MVQPTDWHVPRISFTVPSNLRAIDLGLMVLAISLILSSVRLPLCLTKKNKTKQYNAG